MAEPLPWLKRVVRPPYGKKIKIKNKIKMKIQGFWLMAHRGGSATPKGQNASIFFFFGHRVAE
jgi:hypothetical protein